MSQRPLALHRSLCPGASVLGAHNPAYRKWPGFFLSRIFCAPYFKGKVFSLSLPDLLPSLTHPSTLPPRAQANATPAAAHPQMKVLE